jgi:putative SOS response-associated peptidase YedK
MAFPMKEGSMCERFALYSDMASIRTRFRVQTKPVCAWIPRWNLARGDEIPIIRRGKNGRREITGLNWGLAINHPLLECENGPATSIAARSLKRGALLKTLFETQRCILPLDAFYLTPSYAKAARPWAFALDEECLWALPPSGRLPPKGADRGALRS